LAQIDEGYNQQRRHSTGAALDSNNACRTHSIVRASRVPNSRKKSTADMVR